jgi:transcription elongation factor Elf1
MTQEELRFAHYFVCPFCKAELTILSPLQTIFIAQNRCSQCGKEFLIEDGRAKLAAR